jgi:hypothetical protein
MSVAEMSEVLGKSGLLQSGPIRVGVKIIDVKVAYGNKRYFIEPLQGSGRTWVDADRVFIDPAGR